MADDSPHFAGRTLVIATKHAKEQVIAPILEADLGLHCVTPDGLDTDLLGTFTGEIERVLNPLDAAREKCKRAMDLVGCDLAVASEGSFGPHPNMPFVPGNEEMLVLVDRHHGLELVVREVSADTNFDSTSLASQSELLGFAEKVGFPDHGLILRRSRDSDEAIHKGIREEQDLLDVFQLLNDQFGDVLVETDMRAMHNPTRMSVIEAATHKLVELARAVCPECGAPGFSVAEVVRGLPCAACGLPTNSASRYISVCKACAFSQEQRFPQGKEAEDPMYCEFCNP
ncbi:MAG: hypothetical protein Cons2KO_12770 [Congregibacter sp.]